jgi:hypothetical protein
MAANSPSEPVDLYAALSSRRITDILNAQTRPTRREDLLELFLIATEIQGGNGELRFPRAQLDQAAMSRAGGRRLRVWFDPVTYEYVLDLTRPTEPGQQQIPVP